jgi:hypothetical protein
MHPETRNLRCYCYYENLTAGKHNHEKSPGSAVLSLVLNSIFLYDLQKVADRG